MCVCSSESCDTLEPVQAKANGTYQIYSSDKDTDRFALGQGSVSPGIKLNDEKVTIYGKTPTTITINRDVKQQEILGFGGAFTDATGINIRQLSEDVQTKLLDSYFGKDGLQYNVGRVPMGGTDFSTKGYTYDDTIDNKADPQLEQFNLQPEDHEYKIPFIKKAKQINPDLELLASTWTAPRWMKTNNAMNGGAIKDEYYQVWADYFIKFFENYEKEGISFWGVSTGNEPSLAFFNANINSVGWMPEAMVS